MAAAQHRAGRRGALALGGAVLAAPGLRAQALWSPTRPITLVVGFPQGGRTDLTARQLAAGFSAGLGVPVEIDNIPGEAGNAGTEAVMGARPDGHTLLVGGPTPLAINPHIMDGMSVDPRELVPVGLALRTPLVLCAQPALRLAHLPALRAFLASKAPGRVEFGSPGAGSLPHLAMELLRARLGAPEMQHVPSRGAGGALQELAGGKVALAFADITASLRPLQSRQVGGVLMTGAERSPALPELATAEQQGLADFTISAWIGLFAPRGTPLEVVARLNLVLNEILARPVLRERARLRGDDPGGGTPAALAALMGHDYARWGEVARANRIRADS